MLVILLPHGEEFWFTTLHIFGHWVAEPIFIMFLPRLWTSMYVYMYINNNHIFLNYVAFKRKCILLLNLFKIFWIMLNICTSLFYKLSSRANPSTRWCFVCVYVMDVCQYVDLYVFTGHKKKKLYLLIPNLANVTCRTFNKLWFFTPKSNQSFMLLLHSVVTFIYF